MNSKIKKFSILLLIIDLLLVNAAFMLMNYFKRDTFALSLIYLKLLIAYNFFAVAISLFTRKYFVNYLFLSSFDYASIKFRISFVFFFKVVQVQVVVRKCTLLNVIRYNCYFLIYYEYFTEINMAINREKEIKGWKREKKEELINDFNPE